MKKTKNVPIEETIAKLCEAQAALKQMEFLEIPLVDEALGNIAHAILDLCEVPKDNSADGNFEKPDIFCRDWVSDELDKLIKPGSDYAGFQNVRRQMKTLTKQFLK